ncbi:hypothetical protein BU14_0085s0005 [Porphyra umbilicalis]|uniref:Uncharacterized protein n=1 Tax=Porphyra umbilicalis TaxID=2786 RepID=A0A1X6PE86_PORUM|nr:hypothetical protein BU14_0085s0005 [Porphyra umbilicalis]|eukprot:OSX79154.1 hypothetical protein BU14_0085s0005 [Porphyra umbilicalis]
MAGSELSPVGVGGTAVAAPVTAPVRTPTASRPRGRCVAPVRVGAPSVTALPHGCPPPFRGFPPPPLPRDDHTGVLQRAIDVVVPDAAGWAAAAVAAASPPPYPRPVKSCKGLATSPPTI